MMKTCASSRLGFILATILAVGCGTTVIVTGDTSDMSDGQIPPGDVGLGGGGSTGSTTGSTGSTGDTGPGDSTCSTECSVPPFGETCTCTRSCEVTMGGYSTKISCAPIIDLQGVHKIECVCSVPNFAGVCFEKVPALLCDFSEGCCANYFLGK
jgi:hypothetical protein